MSIDLQRTAGKSIEAAPLSDIPDGDALYDGLYIIHVRWCPHCRKLQPVIQELLANKMPVYSVDVTDTSCELLTKRGRSDFNSKALCAMFEARAFPAIMIVRQGLPTAHRGERDYTSLANAATTRNL
jgi:hypothetical protein